MPGNPARIDIHHHLLPPDFIAWLNERNIEWTGGPAQPSWSPEAAIGVMNDHGIATAIASVIPSVFWGDIEQSRRWATHCNEYSAKVVQQHPDRYGAMATLPLPDTAAACREAEYALDQLGLDAVVLFASQGDQYLGDPAYEELMQELDRRRTVVLIHPHTAPPGSDIPKIKIPYALVEFMMDTSRAVANLLFHGVFERYPNIRWIVAHAGATIPYISWRVRLGEISPQLRSAVPKGTLHYLKQLYYETALSASEPALAALMQFCPPGQILFGSDYPMVSEPFFSEEFAGVDESRILDDADRSAINRGNALALFPRFASPMHTDEKIRPQIAQI